MLTAEICHVVWIFEQSNSFVLILSSTESPVPLKMIYLWSKLTLQRLSMISNLGMRKVLKFKLKIKMWISKNWGDVLINTRSVILFFFPSSYNKSCCRHKLRASNCPCIWTWTWTQKENGLTCGLKMELLITRPKAYCLMIRIILCDWLFPFPIWLRNIIRFLG